jgi:hypothetical protein
VEGAQRLREGRVSVYSLLTGLREKTIGSLSRPPFFESLDVIRHPEVAAKRPSKDARPTEIG